MNPSFIVRVCYALAISVMLFACSSSGGGGSTTQTGITGTVKSASGAGLTGVSISVGSASTTTASDGSYQLSVSAGNDQLVTYSKTGYVPQSRHVNIRSGVLSYQPISLSAEAAAVSMDAAAGGTVTGDRNASLTAPPSAFVDSSSNAVTGSVDISLTPLDPSVEAEASMFPGDLRGVTTAGATVPLMSYGILGVSVRQNGADLQIKSGEQLALKMPTLATGDKPDTMRIWTFNADGTWHENETGGTYDASDNTYSTTVSHLSWFNQDLPFDPACVRGAVQDANGNPVSGARVMAQPGSGTNSSPYSWTSTDENGNYCMTVQRDLPAKISVLTNDGTLTQRTIQASATLSTSFPADCSKSSCQQLYSIAVATSDTGRDSADSADCSASSGGGSNLFNGACNYGIDNFLTCFRPEGVCTSDLNFITGNLSFTFENGARMGIEINATSAYPGQTLFYGPSGIMCGSLSSSDGATTITFSSGGSVTMTTTESGAILMTCSNGDAFLLTGSQGDEWRSCTGSTAGNVSGVPCTPAEGSFGASCTLDSGCDLSAGNLCCGRYSDSKLCLPTLFCSTYDESSCRTSSDCDAPNVCCSAGYFSLCLSVDQCLSSTQ